MELELPETNGTSIDSRGTGRWEREGERKRGREKWDRGIRDVGGAFPDFGKLDNGKPSVMAPIKTPSSTWRRARRFDSIGAVIYSSGASPPYLSAYMLLANRPLPSRIPPNFIASDDYNCSRR